MKVYIFFAANYLYFSIFVVRQMLMNCIPKLHFTFDFVFWKVFFVKF